MSVILLTKESFSKEVIASNKPILIDFFATWCGPCKKVSPIINEISEEFTDIKVCKVDVDQEPEIAHEFEIVSIPTIVIVKNGKITSQAVGYRSKEAIISMLD